MLFHSDITLYEEFAGVGGTSFGATRVKWIRGIAFANHKKAAMDEHIRHFPDAAHYQEDITKLDIEAMPYATIFGGSPVCPPFSTAAGIVRDFDKKNSEKQLALFAVQDRTDDSPRAIKLREKYARGRLLMHEPIRYLRAMTRRHGRPVLGGVIENVPQARAWVEFDAWLAEFWKEGYYTKVIAYNSMFAAGTVSPGVPQSRNRMYVVFWHRSIGRNPDFDKWLRPQAYCATCARTVNAIQVFKKPGADMGNYGAQYTYRCPTKTCGSEVFPPTLPATSIIDPTIPGVRLGDRESLGMRPLVEDTMTRIWAGVHKFWLPAIAGAVHEPGRPAFELMPFITPMRGGGDKGRARPVTAPVHTVTAGGRHHGLALPPAVIRNYTARPAAEGPGRLLVPYYGGPATTRDLDALAGDFAVEDVIFRMLDADELGLAMGFPPEYDLINPSRTARIDLYGNAVTPAVAELIYSALAECIAGEELPREAYALAG